MIIIKRICKGNVLTGKKVEAFDKE
jgi:hypothetical protein